VEVVALTLQEEEQEVVVVELALEEVVVAEGQQGSRQCRVKQRRCQGQQRRRCRVK
jgi:hypothetical protein